MHDRSDLPPMEIVTVEEVSHIGATRLRVEVAVSPEDTDALPRVAQAVMEYLDSDHDIVWIFFHASTVAASSGVGADARAVFVRNDMQPQHRPKPLTCPHGTIEIEMQDGILTVERSV